MSETPHYSSPSESFEAAARAHREALRSLTPGERVRLVAELSQAALILAHQAAVERAQRAKSTVPRPTKS